MANGSGSCSDPLAYLADPAEVRAEIAELFGGNPPTGRRANRISTELDAYNLLVERRTPLPDALKPPVSIAGVPVPAGVTFVGIDLIQTVAFRRILMKEVIAARCGEDREAREQARRSIQEVGKIIASWGTRSGRPGRSPRIPAAARAAREYLAGLRQHKLKRSGKSFGAKAVRNQLAAKHGVSRKDLEQALEAASRLPNADRRTPSEREIGSQLVSDALRPMTDLAEALQRAQEQARSRKSKRFQERSR
jgi:hypothetical protein